eukprot:4410288-Alexandrium_andersonii.AAC.1
MPRAGPRLRAVLWARVQVEPLRMGQESISPQPRRAAGRLLPTVPLHSQTLPGAPTIPGRVLAWGRAGPIRHRSRADRL